jgi:SAM domain (Sterile alpha motif)
MDLGGWLRSLGLGQYEAAFRENAIDDTVLPNLTAEDLKDPRSENRDGKQTEKDRLLRCSIGTNADLPSFT